MFCKKCGTPLDDDARFCNNCGTPVDDPTGSPEYQNQTYAPAQDNAPRYEGQTYAPVQDNAPRYEGQTYAPVQDNAPRYEGQTYAPMQDNAPHYEGQTYAPVQDNAPRHANPTYAPNQEFAPQFGQENGGAVVNEKPKMPKKKKILMIVGIVSAVVLIAVSIFLIIFFNPSMKTLEKSYFHNIIKTYKNSQKAMTNSSYSVDMQFGQYLVDLAKEGDVDLSWLKTANLDIASEKDGNRGGYSAKLTVNDTEITTLDAVVDLGNRQMLFTLEGLSDKVGKVDMPFSSAALTEILQDETVYKLAEKYYGMAWDSVKNIEKTNGAFQANGITQNCKVFTARMSERELIELEIKILTEAMNDKDIKKVIMAMYDPSTSGYAEYKNADEYYTYIQNNMSQTISRLTGNLNSADNRTKIMLIDYVSGRSIIGRNIVTYSGSSEDANITFGYARSGKNIGMEVKVNDTTYAYGNGQVSGASISGQAFVTDGSDQLATINFDNFNVLKYTGGIEVSLSKRAWRYMIPDSSMASMLEPISLRLDLKKNGGEVHVTAGSEMLMEATIKKGKKRSVSIDTGLPQVESYDYFNSINKDELKSRLRQAGMPEEYLRDIAR